MNERFVPSPEPVSIGWTDQSEMTFRQDIELEATVLRRPLRGRDFVQKVMAAAAAYYSSLTFTYQVDHDRRTYLEWDATGPTGTPMSGITILTRSNDGLIEHIAIHHRPLEAAMEFSRALGQRIGDALPPGAFSDIG